MDLQLTSQLVYQVDFQILHITDHHLNQNRYFAGTEEPEEKAFADKTIERTKRNGEVENININYGRTFKENKRGLNIQLFYTFPEYLVLITRMTILELFSEESKRQTSNVTLGAWRKNE